MCVYRGATISRSTVGRKDNKMEAAAEPELEILDVRSWWPGLKWRCAKKERKKPGRKVSRASPSSAAQKASGAIWQGGRSLRGETSSCPTYDLSKAHKAAALRELPQPVC